MRCVTVRLADVWCHPSISRRKPPEPVVPQNVVHPRDMSRDEREGDPGDRPRTLTRVADGSTSAH